MDGKTIPRILIVEDESITAMGIQIRLEGMGYLAAGLAYSGQQAIELAGQTSPDLALMDIHLGKGIDGIEAAQHIRASQDIPVIFLTAYVDDETIRRAKEASPYGYLLKPFEDRELQAAIEMALHAHGLEKKLRESEARYRAISEAISDFAFSVRLDPQAGLATEWTTEAYARITGYQPGQVFAQGGWSTLIHPDDRAIAQQFLQDLSSGRQRACEFRIVARSGQVRWLRVYIQPQWDQGRVTRLVGAAQDVTERKQAEEQIRQLNQDLQRRVRQLAALNRAGQAVASLLDRDEVLKLVIRETRELLAAEAASALLCNFARGELIFAAADSPAEQMLVGVAVPMARGIAGWVAREGQLALVNDAAGDPRFYAQIDALTGLTTRQVLAAPLMIGETVIGVVEVVNKLAGQFDQRDAEVLTAMTSTAAIAIQNARLLQAEREQREFAETLAEVGATLAATLEIDVVLNRILEQVNRVVPSDVSNIMLIEGEHARVARSRGYERFDAEAFIDTYTFPLSGISIRRQMIETGEPIVVPDVQADPRWTNLRREMAWLRSYAAAPICLQREVLGFINVGSAAPGFFTPQHAERLYAFAHQAAIALQNARLYHAERAQRRLVEQSQARMVQNEKIAAIGRLTASLAHEINNPLQALRSGFDRLLNRSMSEERQRQYLEMTSREVDRLIAIVQQILGFSRPSEARLAAADVNALLDETLLLVGKQLRNSQIRAQRNFAPDLPPLMARPEQLKQVFINIILNAQQAMPAGGELVIATCLDAEANEIRIAFTDSGEGIPPDAMPHLFEPFFTTKADGIGIGLTISYSIVEKHGGRIEVKSCPGAGSTFTVVLPIEA